MEEMNPAFSGGDGGVMFQFSVLCYCDVSYPKIVYRHVHYSYLYVMIYKVHTYAH